MNTGVGTLASKFLIDTQQAVNNMVQLGQMTQTQADRMVRSVKSVEAQLRSMAKATQDSANSAKYHADQTTKAGHAAEEFSLHTAAAKREVLVLAHELSQGNYSRFGGSLLVLAERTNAWALATNPLVLGLTAVAVAAGGVAAAALIGAHEAEEFRKTLILTGNAAGLTAVNFDAIAYQAAHATVSTVGSAKQMAEALARTGRVGSAEFGEATKAGLLMEKLTGGSAEEIAKDFARMGDDVAKWAAENNKQYHFISALQYSYIKKLQDQGDASGAAVKVYEALNTQMGKVNKMAEEQAGWWDQARMALSKYWDVLKHVGAPDTTADQLAFLRARRASLGPAAGAGQSRSEAIASVDAQIEALRLKARAEQQVADATARTAQVEEKKIDALRNAKQETPVSMAAYDAVINATQKYLDESTEMLAVGRKLSDVEKWRINQLAELRKQTEGLTFVARLNAQVGIEAAASQMRQAEALKKSTEMEAEMQKLLSDKGLIAGQNQSFDDEKQIAATKYLNSLPDQAKRAEQMVNGSFQRMEDAIVAFSHTGKLSFSSLFQFMADEYVRNLVRMAEKKFLTDSAGNFVGMSQGLSNVGSWLSGLFGVAGTHATGLDYVPYDGYLAMLHKGERVQTAVQASNGRSGGGGAGGNSVDASVSIGSVGSGVSEGRMMQAISQAQAVTMARLRRMQQQGYA
jgi:phage-related minor tail protein